MQRRLFVAGNWKMNTTRDAALALASGVAARLTGVKSVDVAVFPPFPYLTLVHETLNSSPIGLGAQNVYFEKPGAFTGEVAATMLADCGCRYVIIGHSERRHVLGETDEMINRKVKAALDAGLHPVLCVGELLAEREANKTQDVVASQTRAALVGVALERLRDITLAYEPVWAIGTGKVATPEQAEEVHAYLRDLLTKMFGADLAQSMRIQYGGSVKADNAEGLLSKPNIDGALIGGVSLKADEFTEVVRIADRLSKHAN